jgi:cell wall-associated NlpC family hydrolase
MQSIRVLKILPARSRNWLCLAALLALGACSWAPPQPTASAQAVVTSPVKGTVHSPAKDNAGWGNWGDGSPESSFRERIVHSAMAMMGTPYRYGGATPNGFDCSGLVVYSYKQAGVRVPRTSREQYRKAKPVPVSAARPGDLVFFGTNHKVSHVGIYLGDDEFIHAPEAGQNVKISSIRDDYYRAHFAGIGRID